jgi:hypothetical protein
VLHPNSELHLLLARILPSSSLSLSRATTPNPNPILQTPETPSHGRQGFHVFSILRCSHTGDHSQEKLAKFGYRSERKVVFVFRLLLYFGDQLEPNSTYSQNMAIS